MIGSIKDGKMLIAILTCCMILLFCAAVVDPKTRQKGRFESHETSDQVKIFSHSSWISVRVKVAVCTTMFFKFLVQISGEEEPIIGL